MATGLKINNGDFSISNKKVLFVEGRDKALRDIRKFLVTDSEHPENITVFTRYNPRFGTELNRRSLYKNLGRQAIIDIMNQKLNDALKWYVTTQEARTNLTLGEILTAIDFLVFNDFTDERKIRFTVTGTLSSGETINVGEYSQRFA